ncbi:MAG: hypothetical protein ACR2IT_08565 [Pirellulales bacterium]
MTDSACRDLRSLVAMVLLVAGCGRGPALGDLSGEVNLDGSPLAEGAIRFEPADGKGSTAGASIQNGRYNARMMANGYRVQISSADMTPPPGLPAGEFFTGRERIPARYNEQKELTVDVKQGANSADFDLRSK